MAMGFEAYIVPLISLGVFLAIVGLGGAAIAYRASRRRPVMERLEAGTDVVSIPVSEHQPGYWKALHGLGAALAPKGTSQGLRDQMSRAGFYGRSAPTIFLGSKMLMLVLGLVGVGFLVVPLPLPLVFKVLLVLLAGMAGMLLPSVYLSLRCARRQGEVRRHLPDAVDLLEICVSAGMGLDMAWRAVASEVRRVSSVLSDEMNLTDLEINLGESRAAAMRHMAERTGAEDLNALVTAFLQSERFGTSISETLHAFATAMREQRQTRAEEGAEKMSVMILFPLIVFIFPVILIVTAGPAVIRIAQVFGQD